MMTLNNPALWRHIENKITEQTKSHFCIRRKQVVHGGSINQTFSLQDNKLDYFIKINTSSALDNFQSEANGLSVIEKTNTIKVPKVICCGLFENYSYLILESLKLNDVGSTEDFAFALASLHKNQQSTFGFPQDNYIGSTRQINTSSTEWLTFFLQNRIGFQLDLLESKYTIDNLRINERMLKDKAEKFFENYTPVPSLLHGDLWQGNYSFDQQGIPVIFDPACYFGDHETDLAMFELFGSPGARFFEVYHKHYPVHEGYQQRKMFYNLYHILNHANMFGTTYLAQANKRIEQVVAC